MPAEQQLSDQAGDGLLREGRNGYQPGDTAAVLVDRVHKCPQRDVIFCGSREALLDGRDLFEACLSS